MGDWYSIGVALGLGLGLGLALSGILAVNRVGVALAVLLGALLGGSLGLVVDNREEVVAGGIGGLLGAGAAAIVVHGALERGATRMGLATYVGALGVLVLLLAFLPLAGFVLAAMLPLAAARARGRRAARYAGLRTLAK
ncbi:MAG: hypothetical protein RMM28_07885 [Thermoleophilia bacterium]|nr:hypothetical protein [Gaiellaceae bacterium]MDW8339040.1 hypothetical protein [Thermoleophilia bacterium]